MAKNPVNKNVKINFEDQETTIEVMADAIKEISLGIKSLRSGKLNEKALLMLIQGATKSPYRSQQKVSVSEIRAVIDGIQNLEKTYLK